MQKKYTKKSTLLVDGMTNGNVPVRIRITSKMVLNNHHFLEKHSEFSSPFRKIQRDFLVVLHEICAVRATKTCGATASRAG